MRRRKREIIEENKFVRKARRLGWEAVKLTTAGPYGSRGYNDRVLFGPYRTVVLFEFKREDEVAEPLQDYRHRRLRRLGHKTHVVYTASEALEIAWKEIQAQEVSVKMRRVRNRKTRSRFLFSSGSREDYGHPDGVPHSKKIGYHR